ncbi:MAG: ribosome silencing factor [Oscillospiraceae bacterium]|jgi:ribosome-associated protein|nr:ribosome silencing factor [Oscillospiraceae bacterium]
MSSSLTSRQLAERIAHLADDKKASDVKVLQIENLTVLADYFVICTGNVNTHVRSISDEIEYKLKETENLYPLSIEGYEASNWILIDYGSVVAHVFLEDTRSFYSIEKLWGDAPKIEIEGLGQS